MNKCKRCGEEYNHKGSVCDKCFDYWRKNIPGNKCMCCHENTTDDLICEECKNRETPYLQDIKPGDRVKVLDSTYWPIYKTRCMIGGVFTVYYVGRNYVQLSDDVGVVWRFSVLDVEKVEEPNEDLKKIMSDDVKHPNHYTSHPSGIECITITKHHNFCTGNAIKYLWRCGLKGGEEKRIEDLKKAKQYIDFEIKRLEE